MSEAVRAELTWTGESFERGVVIEIDDRGRITNVTRDWGSGTRDLSRQALLPGFISAHSHAFQRGLRGYGESFPQGQGSFWSWRESMYSLVEELTEDEFYALTYRAFEEMLRAGITCVGEFHYLHEFDDTLLQAARDAGIRLVLLDAFYRTGGIGRPLQGAQRRFASRTIDQYWRNIDRLSRQLSPSQTIGAVAHSIRAATPDEIAELYAEAARRDMVFHMHLEEQRLEIEEAIAAYGAAPMRILLEQLDLGADFTGVHCTHTSPADLEEFLDRGGNVCLAPLTEANLGDGIPPADVLRRFHRQISLGTDSNARISMLEEMRSAEYAQRLATETRGALRNERGSVSAMLIQAATAGGARALGIKAGAIAAGMWADLVAVDLDAPQLAGWTEETLLDALVFGAGDEVIRSTCVGGKWRDHRRGLT